MVANIAVFADSKFRQRLPNVKIFTAHCIFTFPKSFGFFDFFPLSFEALAESARPRTRIEDERHARARHAPVRRTAGVCGQRGLGKSVGGH